MSILVGIDDSAHGWAALDWAAREAGLRGVALEIVHAFPCPPVGASASADDLRRWGTAERLLDEAEITAQKLASDVRAHFVCGAPAKALIERSDAAELVVVGTRGRRRFHGLLTGSVATRVGGHAGCPAVLVGPGPPPDVPEIVVGVGTNPAGPELRAAFAEAALRGVRLRAVHTWHPVTALTPAGSAPLASTVGQFERREERCLITTLAPWRLRYPRVVVEAAVVSGSPRHVFSDASQDAALLVVGAHEHSDLLSLAFGSTAPTAAYHAECPLLIAR